MSNEITQPTIVSGKANIHISKQVKCPMCGATRFHAGDYVELTVVDGKMKRIPAFTEFRCLGCNGTCAESVLLGG